MKPFAKIFIATLIIMSSIYTVFYFIDMHSQTDQDTYIIKWCAVKTGATGQGSAGFSKLEAEAIAKELNIEYSEILHWIEEYPKKQLGK